MVEWSYFNKFDDVCDKYVPSYGEGDTKATQTATAVCKLIYKWYNDGDVFDNTGDMHGWYNDLSSYANWLLKYTDCAEILYSIGDCHTDGDYEDLLKSLADKTLNEKYLEGIKAEKMGSIYECEGPFRFVCEDDFEGEEEGW